MEKKKKTKPQSMGKLACGRDDVKRMKRKERIN